MIESVWQSTKDLLLKQNLSLNKGQTKLILPTVAFDDTLNQGTISNSSSLFYSPPETAFGPSFSHAQLTDSTLPHALRHFPPHHQNSVVFLAHNQLSDTGFTTLARHMLHDTHVQHLILSHNRIAFSEFAKAGLADLLKINRFIGWLVLNNNSIDSLGATHLANALAANTGLKHLVLSDNPLGDEGVSALLAATQTHPTLESLFLDNTGLTDAALPGLIAYVTNSTTLVRLSLRKNTFLNHGELACLTALCEKKGISLQQ